MSEGRRLLREVDESVQAMARRLGVSKALVGHWRTGHKAPSAEMRRTIATLYGIPAATWDARAGGADGEIAEAASPETSESSPSAKLAAATNRAGAEALLTEILEQRTAGGLMVREFVQLCDAEARVRALIERMEQAEQLTETRIVTSPVMVRLRNSIFSALQRHPDALRDVVAALQSGGIAA